MPLDLEEWFQVQLVVEQLVLLALLVLVVQLPVVYQWPQQTNKGTSGEPMLPEHFNHGIHRSSNRFCNFNWCCMWCFTFSYLLGRLKKTLELPAMKLNQNQALQLWKKMVVVKILLMLQCLQYLWCLLVLGVLLLVQLLLVAYVGCLGQPCHLMQTCVHVLCLLQDVGCVCLALHLHPPWLILDVIFFFF